MIEASISMKNLESVHCYTELLIVCICSCVKECCYSQVCTVLSLCVDDPYQLNIGRGLMVINLYDSNSIIGDVML